MAKISKSYRFRGGFGAQPHGCKRSEKKYPACQDCSAIARCRYCGDEGTVSSERARVIDMMLTAKETPKIGEVSER